MATEQTGTVDFFAGVFVFDACLPAASSVGIFHFD
jgi:hypothetical protein